MSKQAAATPTQSQNKPKKVTAAEAAIALDEINEILARQIEQVRESQARNKVLQEATRKSIAETREILLRI